MVLLLVIALVVAVVVVGMKPLLAGSGRLRDEEDRTRSLVRCAC